MRLHMGHLALRVTDLERSADHLTLLLGLRRTVERGGEILLFTNEKHHEIQLLAGERAGRPHWPRGRGLGDLERHQTRLALSAPES